MMIYKRIPSILLTGASGFLGTEILKQLMTFSTKPVIVISSEYSLLKNQYSIKNKLACYNYDDLFNQRIPWDNIEVVINCAFARSNQGPLLAKSLDFTNILLQESHINKVKGFINISSQSLYGAPHLPPWDENSPVTVSSLYAMAKYATEKITEIAFKGNNNQHTNIRLSSLSGPGFDARLSSKFVQAALKGEPIIIKGGEQVISYMDVRDAAYGLIRLATLDTKVWKPLYNFGSPWSYTILDVAMAVKKIAASYTNKNVDIVVEDKETIHVSGINSELFYKDTNWKPKYNIEDMIYSLFDYYQNF